jgi:hypothetical protein
MRHGMSRRVWCYEVVLEEGGGTGSSTATRNNAFYHAQPIKVLDARK